MTNVDITDSKIKERQMECIATSDRLTSVLNRRGFERDAARRLSESQDDVTGALLFIDLNDFKKINDPFGHEVGDEFVALLPDVDAEVADKLATRLTRALEETYLIGRKTLPCAASIGLARCGGNRHLRFAREGRIKLQL